MLWISKIIQHFQKYFTDYGRGTLALQKCVRRYGVAAQLSLPFPGGKMGCMEKVKTSNISGIMPPIFLILSPYVWKNNGLLNNNYWDGLNIINQGHSKGNISQLCIYFDYPRTNFNKILTTIIPLWPATIIQKLKSRTAETYPQGWFQQFRVLFTRNVIVDHMIKPYKYSIVYMCVNVRVRACVRACACVMCVKPCNRTPSYSVFNYEFLSDHSLGVTV